MVSVDDILKAISDDKALVLFNTIALADGDDGTEIQIRKIGLTSRQYYSRLARLRRADLVRRKNGRYILSLLGKIVYEVHMTICKALSYHWKLKAIESIQMSASATVKLPEEEFLKLLDILIDNNGIKSILTKGLTSLENHEQYPRQQKEEEEEIKVELKPSRLSKR